MATGKTEDWILDDEEYYKEFVLKKEKKIIIM